VSGSVSPTTSEEPSRWECPLCRATSTLPESLARFPIPGRKLSGCAWCAVNDGLNQRVTAYRFLAVGSVVALALWAVVPDPETVQVWDVIAYVFMAALPLVVMHEITHALAGIAVGGRLRFIRLGSGPMAWRSRALGPSLELGRVPSISGLCLVTFADCGESGLRARRLVLSLAPHVLHLALIAYVLLLPGDWNDGRTAFALLNASMIVSSCLDRSAKGGHRGDLLRALDLIRAKSMDDTLRSDVLAECFCRSRTGETEEAVELVRSALERWPEKQDVVVAAVAVFFRAGRATELLSYLDRGGAMEDPSPADAGSQRLNRALGHFELAELHVLARCLAHDDDNDIRAALLERLDALDDLLLRPTYLALLAQVDLWRVSDPALTAQASERAREAAALAPWLPVVQLALSLAHLRTRRDLAAARVAARELRSREFEPRFTDDGLLDALLLATDRKIDAARAIHRRAASDGAPPALLQVVGAEIDRHTAPA